jgi:lysophospholipase L1-like esterase
LPEDAVVSMTIVCFGDSNTWGYVPGSDGERFSREIRWPARLAAALGSAWEVIAEGLNGRTAAVDNPVEDGRNGLPYFLPCLRSHKPVDLVVIYLGTNDVNFLGDDYVARSVARLVKLAHTSETGPSFGPPEVLVVCPPPFGGRALGPAFAAWLDCELLDLDGVTSYAHVGDDIEHLDADGHAAVAAAVEERVHGLFA